MYFTDDKHFFKLSIIIVTKIQIYCLKIIQIFLLIISDFLIIVWSYKYIGDLFTLVHHLMAISAYYFVVVRLFYTVYVNRYYLHVCTL